MGADKRVFDKTIIGKDATNSHERRIVLNSALAQWGVDDVGKIQRIEPVGGNFCYSLWIHAKGTAPSEQP